MEQGIFNNFHQYLAESFEKEHLPERLHEPKNLIDKRIEAFQLFKRKGFPSIKHEDWRFTNLNKILKEDFKLKAVTITSRVIEDQIEKLEAAQIVLVNGQFSSEHSDLLPEGISFYTTTAALEVEQYTDRLGSIASDPENATLALNTAFFKDYYVLHVKAKKLIEKPIYIKHVFTSDTDAVFVPYRLMIISEELSEATVIESFHSSGGQPILASYVTEISVAQSAVLHNHMVNSAFEDLRMIHHREVLQARNSSFNNSNLALGKAAFIRNDFNCRLSGSGTETNLLGSYIINGSQLVDNHTVVDHQAPNCNSSELYKGIMLEKSHGVFNGKVFVRLDAQKTNAFQKNNNLLLSDQATINSKPQLEIFADDVKCSHGSTVGQIDEEALFYLKTRGIGEEAAKGMLIEAFISEVHAKINIPALREYVFQLLKDKLQADRLITA